MQTASITQLLQGQVAVGAEVEIRAWVRTRRDSKAGLSFLQVSDGSCQGTLQVVAKNDLPNYVEGVQKLTAGCSIVARGALVESRGRGQSVELQAAAVEVVGLVERQAPIELGFHPGSLIVVGCVPLVNRHDRRPAGLQPRRRERVRVQLDATGLAF